MSHPEHPEFTMIHDLGGDVWWECDWCGHMQEFTPPERHLAYCADYDPARRRLTPHLRLSQPQNEGNQS